MKKLMYLIALLPVTAVAGGLFPAQPVPMTPGYGKDGSGLHFANPVGQPGVDCVVNPVSFTVGRKVVTETVSETVLVAEEQVISIPANVLFDFDKHVVRPKGVEVLRGFYNELLDNKVFNLTVIGHTDSMGTDEYNMALGQRRADAVAKVLASLGFPVEGLVTESRGEREPVLPNTTADGFDNPINRQINRRVDLRFDKVIPAVTTTEQKEVQREVVYGRNPQVFHRLSQNNTVICGADAATFPSAGFYFYENRFWWSTDR